MTNGANCVPAAALYRGPSSERIQQIMETYIYVAGDPWTGRKLGPTYGGIFRIIRPGKVTPVRFGADGIEIAALGRV